MSPVHGRRTRGAAAGQDVLPGQDIPGDPELSLGDPGSVARTICLRLLTDRPRTRAELADALARRGVPDDAASAVLDRFGEVGLIDDAAFADAWVTGRHAGRGLAGRALRQELRRKGIDEEVAAQAVQRLDADTEAETARQMVDRRLRSLRGVPRDVRMRRLMGLLARKGYGPGLASRVIREALAGEADGPALTDSLSTPNLGTPK